MTEFRKYMFMALTPVHVGNGSSISPMEYYLDGDSFVRFRSGSVFSKMSESERRSYELSMDGTNFREGIELTRVVAKRHKEETTLYRVPIGQACRNRLAELSPRRDNAVLAMPHVAETGRGIIPGTAIKGAIRTALLSGWLGEQPALQQRKRAEIWASTRERSQVNSTELERDVMHIEPKKMEADPFRFLTVRDMQVQGPGFRVDRFEMVNRYGEANDNGGIHGQGISIFGERLNSAADGQGSGHAVVGEVEIGIDTGKRNHAGVQEIMGNAPAIGWDDLENRTRVFFNHRLEQERARFGALYQWLGPESWKMASESGIFLRIGRYAHFESGSLDCVRRGWQPQPKPGRAIESGSTRTVCPVAGNTKVPMGWVWLYRL